MGVPSEVDSTSSQCIIPVMVFCFGCEFLMNYDLARLLCMQTEGFLALEGVYHCGAGSQVGG
jgi:hypothetical protein